jgi:hypothetical protein
MEVTSPRLNKISKSPLIFMFTITIIFCVVLYLIIHSRELFITKFKTEQLKDLGVKSVWYQEDLPDNTKAINTLIHLFKKVQTLLYNLESHHPNNPDVDRLLFRMRDGIKIQESEFEHGTSSYTINKGEVLSFCLRHKDDQEKFHDENTMWFVICHELAHVMSVSEGHNKEFIKNFKFLLKESKKYGLYHPIDYRDNNINYCGVLVTNNPYFNS